jgi:transcriptional regulator with XRE-family HTH domain
MLVDAEKVRTMRLEHGWTQDQFAEMCGLSVRTIQRIEKSGVAALDTSNALAAVLQVERQAILAQGGVTHARIEFTGSHVALIATVCFLLGLGVGTIC